MLHRVSTAACHDVRPRVCEGRFAIDTRHKGKPWQVIVEPDAEDLLLVVVTAYAAIRPFSFQLTLTTPLAE